MEPKERFYNMKTVCEMTSVSRGTIWRWEKSGDFPKRVQIGPRRVAHKASDIEKWFETRVVVA